MHGRHLIALTFLTVWASCHGETVGLGSEVALGLAQMQAGLSELQATNSANVALANIAAQAAINSSNNFYQTLNATLMGANQLAENEFRLENQREKRWQSYWLNQEKLALEAIQIRQNYLLGRAKLWADLIKRGQSQGYAVTTNSGAGLKVRSVLLEAPSPRPRNGMASRLSSRLGLNTFSSPLPWGSQPKFRQRQSADLTAPSPNQPLQHFGASIRNAGEIIHDPDFSRPRQMGDGGRIAGWMRDAHR